MEVDTQGSTLGSHTRVATRGALKRHNEEEKGEKRGDRDSHQDAS